MNYDKDLTKDAQKRIKELDILELDTLFSLRFGGTNRIIGFLDGDGTLDILWVDFNHEVVRTSR